MKNNYLRALVGLGFSLSLCGCATPSATPLPSRMERQNEPVANIPPSQLKADLDFLFSTIEETHPNMYAYISQDEFVKYKHELYSKINRPMDRIEFYKLAAPVIAELRSGHTFILQPFEDFTKHIISGGTFFLLSFDIDNDKVIIRKSDSSNRLPIGGEILRINGQDSWNFVTRLARNFPAEGKNAFHYWLERDKMLWAALWIELMNEDTIELDIKRIDGDVKTYVVNAVTLEVAREKANSHFELVDVPFSFEYLPEYNTGLIKINTFVKVGDFDLFLKETFTKIKQAQCSAIIIDIRKNTGGNSALASSLMEYLTDKPFRLFDKGQVRITRQMCEELEEHPMGIPPIGSLWEPDVPYSVPKHNTLRFDKKVFVLTSPLCLSTSACLAASIRHYGIGTLVGETTGGTTEVYGYSRKFLLSNSNLTLFAACTYFVYPGSKGRCQGVMPDYSIKQKAADYSTSNDTILQFALNLIKDSRAF